MKEEGIEKDKVFRPCVGMYDRHGDYVDCAETITDLCKKYPQFSVGSVSTSIKNNKIYKDHFFIHYSKFSEPPESIDIQYIAEIDGIKFVK